MDNVKSQYVSDERHSRELKAGLHPLRVFFTSMSKSDVSRKIVKFMFRAQVGEDSDSKIYNFCKCSQVFATLFNVYELKNRALVRHQYSWNLMFGGFNFKLM